MKRIALLLALSSAACAPTQRYAFRRCPTVYASLVDFTLSGAALAISVLSYSNGRDGRALGYATGAMTIGIASNLAECRR